jgi:hypothetical protein
LGNITNLQSNFVTTNTYQELPKHFRKCLISQVPATYLLLYYKNNINNFPAVARNVRRNLEDEIEHNGVISTLGWVWDSISHFRLPKVKHPKPLDVALNNYHTYSGHPTDYSASRPSERRRQQQVRKRQQRRPPKRLHRQQQQQQQPQQQEEWSFKRRQSPQQQTVDGYHSAYTSSFYNY